MSSNPFVSLMFLLSKNSWLAGFADIQYLFVREWFAQGGNGLIFRRSYHFLYDYLTYKPPSNVLCHIISISLCQ